MTETFSYDDTPCHRWPRRSGVSKRSLPERAMLPEGSDHFLRNSAMAEASEQLIDLDHMFGFTPGALGRALMQTGAMANVINDLLYADAGLERDVVIEVVDRLPEGFGDHYFGREITLA